MRRLVVRVNPPLWWRPRFDGATPTHHAGNRQRPALSGGAHRARADGLRDALGDRPPRSRRLAQTGPGAGLRLMHIQDFVRLCRRPTVFARSTWAAVAVLLVIVTAQVRQSTRLQLEAESARI